MINSKFTYKYYKKLISIILSYGYSLANYHNYHFTEKPCIIRHDVDYDVHKAVEFALFESSFEDKVLSTYFFLLTSDFYNVFSLKTLKAVEKIITLGYEIGLHFDETNYSINNNEKLFVECVEEELYLLSKALGITVKVVSMHRPSRFALEKDFRFRSAINSYSKEFSKDFKYVSDSRMNWREDVTSIIKEKRFNKLHILTHPFWYSENDESTKEKITKFINRARIDRYKQMSDNFSNINEFVTEKELEL